MKISILSTLLFCLGLTFISQAQQPTIPQEVKDNIISRVDNEINKGIVIGIITSEGTSYFSYGVKSGETNEKIDENSIFEIGSISKTFTGVILADKILKGELNLDDPIQNRLPEGITAPMKNGESIQLVHLSNHTSGLPRIPSNMTSENPSNPYADYTVEQMYSFLNDYELTRDIGSQFEYSNYAVGLLGNLLTFNSQKSYEELMVELIANPLNMENTRIGFTPTMLKELAYGHSNGQQIENWDLPTLAAAGAIRSSASDMVKYISANMGILQSDINPALNLSHQVTTGEGIDQPVGLGWIISGNEGNEYIWHNGATGGYRAFSGFIKNGNLGVVVLTNSDQPITDIGMHILDPTKDLSNPKPSIAIKIKEILENKNKRAAKKEYWKLRKTNPSEYNFNEEQLNTLGYLYLSQNEIQKAKFILKLNLEAFPESANTYDSYAEVLMKNNENKKAIVNYKKSLELNPGNANAIAMLEKLGEDTKNLSQEVIIDDKILTSYVGDYELAPGFILTITKEGSQLIAQATGQGAVPIYPKSNDEFYYKIVDAQLKFYTNESNEVESVTLFQAGQEIVGKKLKNSK